MALSHEDYMLRAIELAKLGSGRVNPNPLVGAVIVKDGEIIGEGYHRQYGELHAERDALSRTKGDTKGATMYVTLEPCCHTGKQPPCVEAIIAAGISTVYVGSDDPNELVKGKGIEILRNAGIDVHTGFMKKECDELNGVFFKYITTKTPYVLLKYAMTMDGKIATKTGKSRWITNETSRNENMLLRNHLMGIMVGINTIVKDNPTLNCRMEGGRNPIRIVCDTNLRIPLDSTVVTTANTYPTWIVTASYNEDKISKLENLGVLIIHSRMKDGVLDIDDFMTKLGQRGIDGILLEGGGTLNYSILKASYVDEIWCYIAPKIFGGKDAISPVEGVGIDKVEDAFAYELKSINTIDGDVLLKYKKKQV